MNTPRQILQILRKDIRGHLLEIGFLLLLHLAFVLVAAKSWPAFVALDGSLAGGAAELVLQIAILVIWALLIVQVVQAETATGKLSYWLTRPFSRLAVPGAKAVFVLLVVHLPSFAAQMAILLFSGIPLSVGRLLLNQVVFLAYWSLPVMLVASLTRSLSQFVLAVAVLVAVVLMMQGRILGRGNVPDAIADLLDPIPIEIAAWMIVVAAVAGAAVFWHYRRRQTLLVAACCAGAFLLLFRVTAAIPGSVEHWGRSLLQGAPAARPTISFRLSAERPRRNDNAVIQRPLPVPDPLLYVSLPLEISATEGIRFERQTVRIRTLTGPERELELPFWLRRGTDVGYWADFEVPQAFFEAEVSVRIEIRFEHIDSYDSDAIPLDGSPGVIDGRLQCGVGAVRGTESGYVLCRSYAEVASASLDRAQRVALVRDSWQPFRFSMNPILDKQVVLLPLRGGDSETPLATRMHVPSGYARQVLEIDRLRLADWVPE